MRLSILSLIFSASHCPLNVTSGMVGTTKDIDCLFWSNYFKRNNSFVIPSIPSKIPSSFLTRLLLHTLLIYTVQIFSNTFHLSSKQSHKKSSLFHEVFLMLLTHQYHLVKFDLTMAKVALEIIQVITCTLGVTYKVNVRDTESLMLNMVVSPLVYKSFFDWWVRSEIHWWVHCSCRRRYYVYILRRFLNNLRFSKLHYDLEQTTDITVVACHCIATAHVNYHQL